MAWHFWVADVAAAAAADVDVDVAVAVVPVVYALPNGSKKGSNIGLIAAATTNRVPSRWLIDFQNCWNF